MDAKIFRRKVIGIKRDKEYMNHLINNGNELGPTYGELVGKHDRICGLRSQVLSGSSYVKPGQSSPVGTPGGAR